MEHFQGQFQECSLLQVFFQGEIPGAFKTASLFQGKFHWARSVQDQVQDIKYFPSVVQAAQSSTLKSTQKVQAQLKWLNQSTQDHSKHISSTVKAV
jgi:hypothetical protein